MFQVHLPIKKYQRIAAVAAIVGLVLGGLIPTVVLFVSEWTSPFGSSAIGVVGFLLLTALLGALIVGNGAALCIILISKLRQSATASSRRKHG